MAGLFALYKFLYLFNKASPMKTKSILLLLTLLASHFLTSFAQTASEYYDQGMAQFDSKNYNGAKDSYTKYLELKPDGWSAYYSRAKAKLALNDFTGGIQDLNKYIEHITDLADAWYLRGYAKQELTDFESSINDLSKAIELKPDHANAYFYRGYSKYSLEDMIAALPDLNKAIELGTTETVAAYFCRGHIRFGNDDLNNAIEDFNKTIELKPDFAQAWFFRCLSKIILEDKTGGCSDCSKALELGHPLAADAKAEYCK